jgi:hypothetical protein
MRFVQTHRLAFASIVIAAAAAASLPGCDDPLGELCCEDYKPGQAMVNVDWGLEGDANLKFGVFMQAIGDMSVTASGIISDVAIECEAMAREMGTTEVPEGGSSDDAKARAEAWCGVAFSAVAQIRADAGLTIDLQAPSCKVQASAQANCEASCQADVSCQEPSLSARCDPGKLSGSCSGECSGKCEGEAGVAVECSGSCSARCEGSCSGTCNGICQGECSAQGADGKCTGTCSGTCSGSCDATCEGKCEGSCQAEAGASVKCDGKCTGGCDVELQAPSCEAELTPPSCEADANCSGGCKASASAKAECTPPSLTITASGAIDASIEAKITSIKVHLPKLAAALLGRVELIEGNVSFLADASADLAASGELDLAAGLCIVKAASDIAASAENITASASLAIDLTAAIGG